MLVAVLAALIVVSTTLTQLANQSGVALPFRVFPADGLQLLLRDGVLNSQGGVVPKSSDLVLPIVRRANAEDPLLPAPLLIVGSDLNAKQRFVEAVPSLEAARRRDPRLAGVRMLLSVDYLAKNQSYDSVRELLRADTLAPELGNVVMTALTQLYSDPNSRKNIISLLRQREEWRTHFLLRAADTSGADAAVREVFGLSETSLTSKYITIAELSRVRRYALAHELWQSLPGAPTKDEVPVNALFQSRPSPPPFNWTFGNDASFSASIEAGARNGGGGTLDIEYYGGDIAHILSQTLLLEPGKYVISAEAENNEVQAEVGNLIWVLRCADAADTSARLVELPFDWTRSGRLINRAALNVPANCRAQVLSLEGRPGDLNRAVHMRFSKVVIQRGQI